MERETRINSAKRRFKKLISQQGVKRNARFHQQAADDTLHRLRSLEGLCGHCENMELEFYIVDRKKVAEVHCRRGHNPVELYGNTPLGRRAECPDYE